MCNDQSIEYFPIKGNGHPIIDRDLYTHCSHHTSSRRVGAPNIFPQCPVSWFWPIRFSCVIPGASPMFLALSTTVVSSPWKNTEVFVALLSGRSCRCTWALWVDDPRNTCWPSVEKKKIITYITFRKVLPSKCNLTLWRPSKIQTDRKLHIGRYQFSRFRENATSFSKHTLTQNISYKTQSLDLTW